MEPTEQGCAPRDDLRYWPWPIDWPGNMLSEFDRDWVDLMETAFAEGYKPRDLYQGSCVVLGQCPEGRSVDLIRRGRLNGWQINLIESDTKVVLGPFFGLKHYESECFCVRPPFRDSAHLALEWMRGRKLDSILAEYEFDDGRPPGIKRRRQSPPAKIDRRR